MALPYHPEMGTIVICDFRGFIVPEMVKRRAAVVISPKIRDRAGLCTIVPLSMTEPHPVKEYHYKLVLDTPLPHPYASPFKWVKGDMLATVSFKRLDLPCVKDSMGKRAYITIVIKESDLREIRKCVLHALSFSFLTKHL